MAVFQHYYTSFVNQETGNAGFQVKAMSPGIPADTQSMIMRMISYRIPQSLDEHALATHPQALRYFYKDSQECILLCSQSNGTDENGRPGNFFAHSLVMNPDFFCIMPPILYWRSPFWRSKDTSISSQIAPLPDFESVEPALDVEGVWGFLAQGQRVDFFYKLMCAVVRCNSTHRRIVIIDSADNVAQWIAAVSCMLPPDYRPMLSFATYHHDPYQSQFMITGTTSDSSFRASPDEYRSYFILNMEMGKVSDIEGSPYADEAKNAARSLDVYKTRLLSLFSEYTPRFPKPTRIDEQLDILALYAHLFDPARQEGLASTEVKAISVALTSIEQQSAYTQDDLKELQELRQLLWDAYTVQEDPAIHTEYNRVVVLLRKHKVSTDAFVLSELKYFTKGLLRQVAPDLILPRLDALRNTYGEDKFLSILNQDTYLQWLQQPFVQTGPQQLQRFWKYLGLYLTPDKRSLHVLVTSLTMINELHQKQQSDQKREFLKSMAEAMAKREKAWLQLAVVLNTQQLEDAVKDLYYFLVYPLDLARRMTYRRIMEVAYPTIVEYEVDNDVYNAGARNGLLYIESWADYAKQAGYDSTRLVYTGLRQLKHLCAAQQWTELAPQILVNKHLAPLSQKMADDLLQVALSAISLSRYTPEDVQLCQTYKGHPGLEEETRLVIDGILAMHTTTLDEDLATRLHQHFKRVSPQTYQAEVRTFLSRFFTSQTKIDYNTHVLVIRALFMWDQFWQPYWEMFSGKMEYASTAGQVVDILAFWFTPPHLYHPYIVPDFFIRLPSLLEDVQKSSGNKATFREINALAAKQPWYSSVQDMFVARKGVFAAVGENLMRFPRLRSAQSSEISEKDERAQQEQEARMQQFEKQMAQLFAERKALEQHKQNLLPLYKSQQGETFWTNYWKYFVDLLLHKPEQALGLLSFWFDESFDVSWRGFYVPQEFFLGLGETLEEARKERGFREVAPVINGKGKKDQKLYKWYPLVQSFFLESGGGRFGFFRRN